MQVDESKGAVVFQRYYHLFTQQVRRGRGGGGGGGGRGGGGAGSGRRAAGPAAGACGHHTSFVLGRVPYYLTRVEHPPCTRKVPGLLVGPAFSLHLHLRSFATFSSHAFVWPPQELAALVEEALAAGPAADGADDTSAGAGGGDEEGKGVAARAQQGGSGSSSGSGGGAGPGGLCGVLEEVFYDRSNWCAVFRRDT